MAEKDSGCGVSLSVGALWRELGGGSLAGDPEGYLEKALETGISFHRSPVWGTWRTARLPGTLRAGWRGLWGWSITLWRGSVEGASGGAPSLGNLEDPLRKSPDTGIFLHGVPFPSEVNLVMWEGGIVHRGLWYMNEGGLQWWGVPLWGIPWRGLWGRVPLRGEPE